VVLVNEIDKADPDVPNGLLGPLGTTSFVVSETGAEVKRPMRTERELAVDPVSLLLVVITTNEERDLPAAFTRRCVAHHLRHPGAERLVQIARLHFGHAAGFDETLARALASRIDALRTDAVDESRRPPSTAEYLDAVRACHALGVSADDTTGAWSVIERATLAKDAPAAT
jgi:MoxR-like ATPase